MTLERVHVRYTKWDGTLHWHFDLTRLGEDEHGVWLGGPDDTPVQRNQERPILSPAFALLMPRDAFYTVTFNTPVPDHPFSFDVYVDICTPPAWDGDTVTSVDLDLDVGRGAGDGSVHLLDEDEFDEHRAAMEYPDHIVAAARAAAAATFTAVEANDEPYKTVGMAWLEQAKTL